MNAQSLLGNFNEIVLLIESRSIDILCITETWLESTILDRFIAIPGYNVFRHDKGRGGGSCIYVRDDLEVKQIETNVNREVGLGIEDVWIIVQCRKLPSFIVGCVYRHPKAPALSFNYLLESFRSMCLRKKAVYIFGDFNDDLLSVNSKLLKVIEKTKMSSMINKPTRVTEHSSTLLDPVITNLPKTILQSDVIPGPIADHELISVIIDIMKPKRQPIIRTFRSLKNYSPDILCNLILNQSNTLDRIMLTDNVDSQVEVVTTVFMKCLDSCAPILTKEIGRPNAPWLTNDIKKDMKTRDDLQKMLKGDRNNSEIQQQYKILKHQVKNRVQAGIKKYYNEKLGDCKSDMAKTWKVIKSMAPEKSTNVENRSQDELMHEADKFNEYFANVGIESFKKSQENLDSESQDEESSMSNPNQIRFRPEPVDLSTIILTIKELNETNAFGSDGIPFKFIRDALPVVVFYILVIVNTSIVTLTFPSNWKYPHVLPFFKGGDKNEVSNYRPISLLPILSKVLEKIVSKQLMSYLESNHILSNHQHGFRPRLSTETALMKVTEKLYSNIDDKKISLLMLLDLSKAFDSVSHEILIKKLLKYNIDPSWFQSYLSDRYQAVRAGNVVSSPRLVSYGVPQGSILGPILFLIYVNDIPDYVKGCLLVQYADDTQLVITGTIYNLTELIRQAEQILEMTKHYFQMNGLMVNEVKTQCIFVGSRQYISKIPRDTTIKFGSIMIAPSTSVKNLGIYMDQYLLYDIHINEITKKTTGILYYLNRIKQRFDLQTRTMLVQAVVVSILKYCLRIWGMTTKSQIEKAQKLQNFAAKVAVGDARKYDHVSPILNKLGWLRLEEMVFMDICLMIFKYRRGLIPDWLFSIHSVHQVRDRRTRQSNELVVNRSATDIAKNSFLIAGPLYWNKLPSHVKNVASLPQFKNVLKKHLLGNRT